MQNFELIYLKANDVNYLARHEFKVHVCRMRHENVYAQ